MKERKHTEFLESERATEYRLEQKKRDFESYKDQIMFFVLVLMAIGIVIYSHNG